MKLQEQNETQQKDLLFYSNYCEFSKDVMGIITKHNLRDQFAFICIDLKKYNIPQFIDRVPSILKNSGEVFTDDKLFEYLEQKHKNNAFQEEISPVLSMYGNSIYSTSFSSIDGGDEDNLNCFTLGKDQRMIDVVDTPNSSKKSNDASGASGAFEKLMESRKRDDTFLKQTLPRST